MTGPEIREAFLRYFEERGHRRVPSSSLVPGNDPTLFFANAGMVQFKDLFLGRESRDYVRAASSQKCMRVSGKHNDLENVGRTTRHHTFFEMLGNFSFGDYFKKEAIGYGWEFLTRTVGLPADRLLVTVFETDDEAGELWQEVAGLPASRIHRLGEKDNFWAMGDTGPCGPCSEILIDQGEPFGCGSPDCGPACDCPRYLELWNLVFMQYDRDSSGKLTPLPRPSIDTGMGLERLAAVLQGERSNYHTDLVFPFVQEASRLSGVPYGRAEATDVSLRVIADHVRATAFLVADGVLPSNEGRGYVLRRIMRRAMRHGKMLGMDGPFLNRICPLVGERMGDAFPEVRSAMGAVVKVVLLEEERFARTLDQGLKRLSELVDAVRRSGGSVLPGDELFRLYDTYGFPLDLSSDIAAEGGLGVDAEGFTREMESQKARARASWAGSGSEAVSAVHRALAERGRTAFLGYEQEASEGTVVGLASGDRVLDSWDGDGEADVVLDRTPFYGAGGGQVGDTGTLLFASGALAVTDTLRPLPDLIVHRCTGSGAFGVRVGDRCRALIEVERRDATRRNHTATHLLQSALREALGDHVKQAGSLVEPARFRFDFSHFSALSPAEVARVEDTVNRHVLANLEVATQVLPMDEAMERGATALFGEKYGQTVRMVTVPGVSVELCGGTHVRRTGDIGLFSIVAEGSVAAGVRRIEGVTGTGVLGRLREEENALRDLAAALKVSVPELPARVARLLATLGEQERRIRDLMRDVAGGGGTSLEDRATEVSGIRLVAAEVPGQDAASLRETADRLRDRLGSAVVVLGSRGPDKALLVCVVSKDLSRRLPAVELMRRLAPIVGGSGGGRPDMAQAGGKDPARLPELISSVPGVIEELSQ